ncbi:Hsp70 family protein [Flavobacterium sp. HJJ]|uniref:Hsp70 family protein n=1 Tax=Flavobacterium sp. HJJ TaxID=2783792 RepID=UPI00188B1A86|nr:Hsp70 family protein [Flavobacterium sp. HJJ]MBF4472754.1 Hsp70 family protein [Flavobacterium sp. HJJ]
MKNINIGIDLGTTNSGIAKYDNGKISIYKNPVGFKDTIPSVVSFRKGRIQIGEKAREHSATNAENVFSSFKRKMGSDEVYYIKDLDKNCSPIELSSMVLNELVNFAQGESLKSAVITIPASFDTIQSNATKKAGYQAGFEEIVLLQEPIAACLAYSNSLNLEITEDKKWLVYDFGGGTFDIALININERELKVFDHKGNNFLGGVDLDTLFVEKIICPKIEKQTQEKNLWEKLISKENTDYNKLFFELLFKAEEAKKELSIKETSSIEVDFDELSISLDLDIARKEFEAIIKSKFEESFHLVEKLIKDNLLTFSDIERIILVGGTTYIPYIRQQLQERTQIQVETSLDPTTAVIIGAAYYAGSKPSELIEEEIVKTPQIEQNSIQAETIYEPHSKDSEELIVVLLTESFDGYYRIIRADGGFDTGLLKASKKIAEFVPLLEKTSNQFTLFLYDSQQKQVFSNDSIQITNGLYSILGQPIPNDICLELDEESGKSHMEIIFKKNDILPLKKTIYKTCSKNILKNSDQKLIINVVEGNAGSMVGSNQSIGYIEISGRDFDQDLVKGMDIELNFKVSESRDLSIDVYISALDLEINEVFNPHQRMISIDKLSSEIKNALDAVTEEIRNEVQNENYEYLAKLKRSEESLSILYNEALENKNDAITDKKYQIDELKKIYIQEFDDIIRHKHILSELEEYNKIKDSFSFYIEKGSPRQKEEYEKIIKNEKEILQSNNKYLIRKKNKELESLLENIYNNQDESYIDYFYYLRFEDPSIFKDRSKHSKLMELGEKAINNSNLTELKSICHQLYNLLIVKPKRKDDFNTFDGNLGIK